MNCKHFAGWLLCGSLFCTTTTAAEPTIQTLTFTHPDGRPAPAEIYVDGEITPALPRELVATLERNRVERATIYINSVGGDLQAGMELGEIIRKLSLNTAIGKRGSAYGMASPGSCQSACLMTFAGGVYRFAEPKTYFGVHRFYSRSSGAQDLALGQVISASITGYLMRMGVSPTLFEKMVNAGSGVPQKLPLDQATKLNLVNNGILPPRWEIVGKGGKVYLQGEQETWNGTGRIRVSCSRAEGIRITAQFNAEENTKRIMAETRHLSLRINGSFIGIQPKSVIGQTGLSEGYLTTTFRPSQSIAYDLSHSRSIGFAWIPADTSIFFGFDVAISHNGDLVYSFMNHCTET